MRRMVDSSQDEHAPRPWTRFTVVVVLVSLALSTPALLAGYWMDDYYFDSKVVKLDAPFGYYEFGDKLDKAGVSPWWASPEFRVSFFRPLSSATLHADFHVWNASPRYAHLHSALWFVLLLLGAVRLLRTLLPHKAARWAAVIFAISSVHAFTVGWIAARHAVVGGALSVWSLLYYLQWRQQGHNKHRIFAVVLFGLGLLASETALTVVALVLAYELLGVTDFWKRRLVAAAPFAALALVYLVFYKANGYGAHGSGVYADPMVAPGKFALGLLPKTISAAAMFLFGLPASLSYMPGMAMVPVAVGAVALLLLGLGLACCWRSWDPAHRRLLKWLGLGAFLALTPSLAALPQGRSTGLSYLAFATLAGVVMAGLFGLRTQGAQRLLALATAGLLCLGLFVLSPLFRLGQGAILLKGGQSQVKLGQKSKLGCAQGSRVYLLNGGLMFSLQAPFIVSKHQGHFFRSWHQLTEPAGDLEVHRSGPDSLTISGKDNPVVNYFSMTMLRPESDALTAGRVLAGPHLHTTVLQTSAKGPTRVRFTIPHLADPRRVCVLYYDDKQGVLKPATLPKPDRPLEIKWHGPQI